jgi:hypothetical protein
MTRAGTPHQHIKLHQIARISYQHISSMLAIKELKFLSAAGSQDGSTNHGHSYACFFLTAVRMNPSKSKLFDAVTCLKTGLAELNHQINQCVQACYHLKFSPLIINRWREKMCVHPLRVNLHINKEPLSGGAFLAALESGIHVLFPAVVHSVNPISEKTCLSYRTRA